MSGNLMKIPTVIKTINLPDDSPIGQPVSVNIGQMHGVLWKAFYTIQNTAKAELKLQCRERSLCPWELRIQMEVVFKGERIEPKTVQTEFLFSNTKTEMSLEPIEQGRKYNKIELKFTRMGSCGVRQDTFVNFSERNKWLNVLIRDKDSEIKLYASAAVLAMNSLVLKEQFESEEQEPEIEIPKESFAGMKQLLNYLHPPYICREEENENDTMIALEFAKEWKMETALNAWEDMLARERRFDPPGHAKCIRFADKFQFRKLFEEVVYDLCPAEIYALATDKNLNCSTWARARLFDGLLLEADAYSSRENSISEDFTTDNHVYRDVFDALLMM